MKALIFVGFIVLAAIMFTLLASMIMTIPNLPYR